MARNRKRFKCTPDDVFEVLANGWLYPAWVVGASRMRDVTESWPEEGAKLHHSIGTWPLLLNDTTSVREWDPPRRMVLRARGWPVGEAQVELDVEPDGDGCIVRVNEYAVAGPGNKIPRFFTDPPLWLRNRETLNRLAYLAEGNAKPQSSDTSDADFD